VDMSHMLETLRNTDTALASSSHCYQQAQSACGGRLPTHAFSAVSIHVDKEVYCTVAAGGHFSTMAGGVIMRTEPTHADRLSIRGEGEPQP
jgi:hypothetical protein